MNRIILERKNGDFGFEIIDENGQTLQTDASPENGGGNFGFRPMQLDLAALGSCSAIDIASIMKKQRQEIESFTISIAGEREQNKIPSLWKSVELLFKFKGIIEQEKAKKAVALSMDKHCSVAETLRRSGTSIMWKVEVAETAKKVAEQKLLIQNDQ
jgi:putative redox protein